MLDCISSFFVFSKQICFLNASRCPNWQIFSFQTKNFLSNEEFLFKQIDTFRENLVFLWNKKPRFLKD